MYYIGVDFDGTIVDHMFPWIGAPVPGAVEWLRRFHARGARIILWTCRSDISEEKHLTQAVEYVNNEGIILYSVNENPNQISWTKSPKAHFNTLIDDTAVGTPLIKVPGFSRKCVDWSKVGPIVYNQIGQ